MGEVGAIYIIWLREMLKWWRKPVEVIAAFMQPIIWLAIFGLGLSKSVNLAPGIDYLAFLAPGVISQTILFTAFFGGVSVLWDREFGFLKEILVSPVSRRAIAAGKVLGGATIAFIQGLLALLLAVGVGVKFSSLASIFAACGVMALISLAFMAFGLAIACSLKEMESFQRIGRFTTMPLWFLSGALYPIEKSPDWLRIVVSLNPLTYGVDALRTLLIGVSTFDLTLSIGVLIAFTASMLALGTHLFNKSEA